MKSLYEKWRLQKKKKNLQLSKEINHCMFIMQVSMNKESLRKQVDQHRRTFVIITSIVTELWAHSYIWSQCHPPTVGTIANVTVVLGFPLSFGHLWSLVKDALTGHLLISKLKQYPFRDFIGCVKRHGWPCTSIHFVFFFIPFFHFESF